MFRGSAGGKEWLIAAIFQIFVTAIAFRSLFVGVYFDQKGVRLVSWIKSNSAEWSAVRRSDAVPYFGLLSKGIDTRLASMIRVTFGDDRMIDVPSTVGSPRAVKRQASALNRLIQDRF